MLNDNFAAAMAQLEAALTQASEEASDTLRALAEMQREAAEARKETRDLANDALSQDIQAVVEQMQDDADAMIELSFLLTDKAASYGRMEATAADDQSGSAGGPATYASIYDDGAMSFAKAWVDDFDF